MTDEFIAADLQLYSNPLNRALGHKRNADTGNATGTKTGKDGSKKTEKKLVTKKSTSSNTDEVQDHANEELIAVDLNKYDSPMKELESKYE